MQQLADLLLEYFIERSYLCQVTGWIGESTSTQELKKIHDIIQRLSDEFFDICKRKKVRWAVKFSIGQGRATPDHYIAILPPGQKVSDGTYFCICFDRSGTGCVLGAMTSLLNRQHLRTPLVVRAKVTSAGKKNPWELISPYTIDILEKNNGFYNPLEITRSKLLSNPQETAKKIITHLETSFPLILELIEEKDTTFQPVSKPEKKVLLPIKGDSNLPAPPKGNFRYLSRFPITEMEKLKVNSVVFHSELGKGVVQYFGQYSLFYVLFESGRGMNFFPHSFEDGSLKLIE